MNIKFNPKWYPELTQPNGVLPRDMAAQAGWTFYTRGIQMLLAVGDGPSTQIILETDQWMDKRLNSIARAVAKEYSLESPDSWQPYWPEIAATAVSLGYPVPPHEMIHLTGKDIIL